MSNVTQLPTPSSHATVEEKRANIIDHGPVMLGLQMVHAEFHALNGRDPDFLLVPGARLKDLRNELRMALKSELPSLDDMKRGAADGQLSIGSFPVFIGTRYGAGIYA